MKVIPDVSLRNKNKLRARKIAKCRKTWRDFGCIKIMVTNSLRGEKLTDEKNKQNWLREC